MANECNDMCKDSNTKCRSTCSSSSDCYECDTDMLECVDACPCRGKCAAGCDYCQHYVCQKTVLILNTDRLINVPVLTNSAALVDKDFNFEIDEKAEVYRSCSLTWENELYVFGGESKTTQISKVTSCRLEPVTGATLNFDHKEGDCVSVAGKKVVLCFGKSGNNEITKKCRWASSPTGTFSDVESSQYNHRWTRIATDDGEFIKLPNKN